MKEARALIAGYLFIYFV